MSPWFYIVPDDMPRFSIDNPELLLLMGEYYNYDHVYPEFSPLTVC